jgi:predicted nucleic-acid-binding Zn-ribbon protein
MKRTGKCPKCGSKSIIQDAKPINSGDVGALAVVKYRNPDAIMFKGKLMTTLSAWVCEDCGFVELYADEPDFVKFPRN